MPSTPVNCSSLLELTKPNKKKLKQNIKVAKHMTQTKKLFIILLVLLSMLGVFSLDAFIQTSYAAVGNIRAADPEKFKAEFTYEMAQLTTKIVSAQVKNNVVKFKVLVSDEIDQTIAKVSPTMSEELKTDFTNEMNQIKQKIYSNPKLDTEKAKADFAYDIARLTSKVLPKIDRELAAAPIPVTPAPAAAPISAAPVPVNKNNVAKKNNTPIAPRETLEKYKIDFKAEMDQLKEKIVSAQVKNNVIKFKVLVDDEVDQTVAKIAPTMSEGLKMDFTNEMNQIKQKIYNNRKLDTEKAKIEFSNDITQLTSKVLARLDQNPGQVTGTLVGAGANPVNYSTGLSPNSSNNAAAPAAAERTTAPAKAATFDSRGNYVAAPQANTYTKPITPEAYTSLLKDVMNVGGRNKTQNGKIKVSGGVRVHYAINNGEGAWAKNTSGVRADVGLETQIDRNWRLLAGFSAKKSFLNYDDQVDFRVSMLGKIGTSTLRAGNFGYFMADGNIYDDSFTGARFDFGQNQNLKYTLSYGKTRYTRDTLVATARYDDLDYSLEAGAYISRMDDIPGIDSNTIMTLSGMYKFSNFSLGSMLLMASQKDSLGNNFGYVHSFTYGDLKPWRKGTYNIWARYYYQPRYTYIAPSMNGRGGWMQGFKGLGIGVNYTFSENLVGSLEYYNLRDITTGAMGSTWWGSLTQFF